VSDKIRWGILATGNIAAQFATDLKHSHSGVLAAAASRRADTAEAFCAAHGGEAVTGYDALLARP
jgi:predicted dehydrogenase